MSKEKESRLPFIAWIVAASSAIACLGFGTIGDYHVAGYAWVVPLAVAIFLIARAFHDIRLPFLVWLPWIGIVAGYLCLAEAPHAFQRGVMLLCPIIVGMAVSCSSVREENLGGFVILCRYLAVALFLVILFKSGLLLTGTLQVTHSFAAAEVMLGCVLGAFFTALYVERDKTALIWWVTVQTLPVVAAVRMAIVATAITLPFTLSPLKLKKRILALGIICLIGMAIFYTPRMQQRMFKSGHGSLSDISMENPDFATTGRKLLWDAMTYRIRERPWLGYGANASEPFVSAIAGGLAHPHNDWLRLLYDYGIVGTAVFAFCLLAQVIHALNMAGKTTGTCRILFYAGASSFVPMVLLMITDNIILYAAFFGNLQFTMLGLAYAAAPPSRAEEVDEETEEDASQESALAFPQSATCQIKP